MEADIRLEQIKSLPQGGEIQNGNTRNHQIITPTRGVGHLNRFQGRLLPYTNTGTFQEIFKISCPGSDIPIQSTTFQSVHGTLGVHCSSKGRGHGGRVVTLLPPTSEAGVRFPAWPQVGKLVVACCWSAVYSTEP